LPAFIDGSGHSGAASIDEMPFSVQIDTTQKTVETRLDARSPLLGHQVNGHY
jgi:hypothetical protein